MLQLVCVVIVFENDGLAALIEDRSFDADAIRCPSGHVMHDPGNFHKVVVRGNDHGNIHVSLKGKVHHVETQGKIDPLLPRLPIGSQPEVKSLTLARPRVGETPGVNTPLPPITQWSLHDGNPALPDQIVASTSCRVEAGILPRLVDTALVADPN